MMGGKSQKQTSSQNQTTTTTLPAWLTQAGESNYAAAQNYINSPDAIWSPDKAAAYANPYQQQVIDRTKAGMVRDNAVELAGVGDQAQAARAYGGTRHGVVEAQVRKDQGDRLLDYEAGANAQGYDAARSAFEADRAAKMGGYSLLTQILQGTPRNVTTSGTSNGTSTTKEDAGLFNKIMAGAQLAGSFVSDRRLKTDVRWIDTLANGLGVYGFRYRWDDPADPEHIGVMADEVQRLMPEAMGPTIEGYMTVDYSKLGGLLPC